MSALNTNSYYGGWKAAAAYYERRMLEAPSPDCSECLDAYRRLVGAEANMVGWASRP